MRRRSPAILSCALSLLAAPAAAAELPRLAWDQPIRCFTTPEGEVVRVQCEGPPEARRCLVAPNHMKDGSALNRAPSCDDVRSTTEYEALAHGGAVLVPALAEAPPGFERSELGRAYQVKFDLMNRVYVGAAWSPTFERAGGPPGFPLGRARAEAGLEISVLSPSGRSRHDLRILEGSAAFKDFQVDGQLLAYDYQHLHRRPGFWVTSFFGAPRVFPVSLPLGWGFRVGGVEDRPPSAPTTLDVEVAEMHASWNPWQSADMYSRLRFEAGADFGRYWADRAQPADGRWYVGFTGAVKSRFALGEGGLHWLSVDLAYLRPTLVQGEIEPMNRLKATFAYEGILLAINDQPLSLRLAATGTARDDPGVAARGVELGAQAGLRFSFWAPARVFEPLPEVESP